MTEFQKWVVNVAGMTILVLAVLIIYSSVVHSYPWPFPAAVPPVLPSR